jgi:glucose-1-phosphate adenylyltransferase
LIGDNTIGKGARVKNVILDRYVEIAPGFTIGYDLEEDKKLAAQYKKGKINISDNGIIVVGKGLRLGY